MIKKRLRNIKDKRKRGMSTQQDDMMFSSLSEKLHMPRFLVKRAGWWKLWRSDTERVPGEFIQGSVKTADDLWNWTMCYQTVWLRDCISHKLFNLTEFYMSLIYKATSTIAFCCDQRLHVQTVINENNFTVISQNLLKKFAMGNFPLPQIASPLTLTFLEVYFPSSDWWKLFSSHDHLIPSENIFQVRKTISKLLCAFDTVLLHTTAVNLKSV